jgi:transcriptional regulator of aromatic amino acid metabolism
LRAERKWPAPLLEQLGIAAQVLANAISRAQADEKLRQAYKEIEELKQRIEKENLYLREEVKLDQHYNEVIGDSQGIRRVLKQVEQVAPTDSTVLVLGETGTGKELIARAIHEHSRRKGRVMVKVNCAALPASLIESELFGREKVHSLAHSPGELAALSWPTAQRYFWMKWGSCPSNCNPNCCAFSKKGNSSDWAPPTPSRWMFV